jgi:anti-sigma regulatory factor (Ser/Thr protein kinase)
VHADEGVLRQVLINLLGNAVKFTASGEVYLGVKRAADERFQFEIIDTGVGIPAAEQARVFEPFYQGSNSQHRGGTGLGLTIAKRQVELLGGKIEFQSEPGFGTRFFFTIPLPPTREAIPAAPALPIEAEAELPPLDFSKLALSEDLCTQLTIAAELHSTTVLKSYLNDLRRLGPDGQLLAEHLRRLMRGYDMDGILKILTQIRVAEQKQNGAPPKT